MSKLSVVDVDDVTLAFPAGIIGKILPEWKEIPDEFKSGSNKWCKIFSDFFYRGATEIKRVPREGVDDKKAWRMIRSCMGSFEPKHEHKEAGVAYMMSEFYEDITYKAGKPAWEK